MAGSGLPGPVRPLKDLDKPQTAAEHFVKYFAGEMIHKVNKLSRLDGYVEWRKKFIRRGRGGDRTVDMDLATLSNILTYGTTLGSDHGFNDVNHDITRPQAATQEQPHQPRAQVQAGNRPGYTRECA